MLLSPVRFRFVFLHIRRFDKSHPHVSTHSIILSSDFAIVNLRAQPIDIPLNPTYTADLYLGCFLRRLVRHIGIFGSLSSGVEHLAFLALHLPTDSLMLALDAKSRMRVTLSCSALTKDSALNCRPHVRHGCNRRRRSGNSRQRRSFPFDRLVFETHPVYPHPWLEIDVSVTNGEGRETKV